MGFTHFKQVFGQKAVDDDGKFGFKSLKLIGTVNKQTVTFIKITIQFVGIIEDSGEGTCGIASIPVTDNASIVLIKDDTEPCRFLTNSFSLKLGISKITSSELHFVGFTNII